MKKQVKSKKGFTLVEIIVVLVILAILAAATVPTMLSYVNKAKESTEIANARSVFLATQTYVTEELAANDICSDATATAMGDKVAALSDMTLTNFAVDMDDNSKKIVSVSYTANGYDVVIAADKTVTLTKAS